MKTIHKLGAVASVALGLAGCAGMTEQEKATAIGAGVGAVGGSVLTDSAAGTLGGAAVGGYIGHEYGKKK